MVKNKLIINTVGQAWFTGLILAIAIIMFLNILSRYLNFEYYNKIFCPNF